MKSTYDLSQLDWHLSGWIPYLWRMGRAFESDAAQAAEVPTIKATVPGSVQKALLDAGVIEDWNYGFNYRKCQWVENIHWVYQTKIPDEWLAQGKSLRLECQGLDGPGWLVVNGKTVAEFDNSFRPHVFDLTDKLEETGNTLGIVFGAPPRWLGQFGFTSKMKEWKPRFNYTWDWVARIVQIGIWEPITLVATDGAEISELRAVTSIDDGGGSARAWGRATGGGDVRVALEHGGKVLAERTVPTEEFNSCGVNLTGLDVERWWPNLHGDQPLYDLRVTLLDDSGQTAEEQTCRVGFRTVEWKPCEDAPVEADPWICDVNGKPIFLQGANWVPIRPNFADVTIDQYRKRLQAYKDLGFNIMRVWGGAVLERECFYDLCDELGLMVWQEFPLSSSGGESYPPDDELFISQMVAVVESYIKRRQHHASLLMWCGGNELALLKDRAPIDATHPMTAMMKRIVEREDPGRRFLPTSPQGPKFGADPKDWGKGLHWDVHGPWTAGGTLDEWYYYWNGDDALFRAETGCPGASPAHIIREYAGECDPMPPTAANPLWRRPVTWWIDNPNLVKEHGREPQSLEEHVEWSQERQKLALLAVVNSCKGRFPRCGGIILWMGHDCFPCTANTSVIDYDGDPKPAALAIAEVFKQS